MITKTTPDEGWAWMVMFASFGAHVVNGCFLYSIGIIHSALLDRYEESVAYTSWAGAIILCLIDSTGPFSSFMMQRFNCRKTTIIGGILLTIGCFISGFMPTLYWVIILLGVIGGIGAGLTYSTSVVVVGLNFESKRTLASGIAVSGCAVGTFLFPPVLTYINESYGYTGLFIILAGISLQHCLLGALFRPSILEKLSKETVNENEDYRYILPYLYLLRSKAIVLMCISVLSWSIGIFMIFLYLPHYAITKNTPPLNASFLISIAGACGFFSRIFTGFLGNLKNVNEIFLYSGSFISLGISTCLFPLYSTTYAGQIIYAIILGMFSGNCYGIMNSINVSLVGIEHMAHAFGMEMFFSGMGSLIGPTVAGYIVDSGGTYEHSFIMAGCTVCLGGVVGLFTICSRSKQDKYAVENEDNGNDINKTVGGRFKILRRDRRKSSIDVRYKNSVYTVPVNPFLSASYAANGRKNSYTYDYSF